MELNNETDKRDKELLRLYTAWIRSLKMSEQRGRHIEVKDIDYVSMKIIRI